MSVLHWAILALIVMAGLAYWNHQRSNAQLAALQGAGFVVLDQLQGNPKLLVSRSQQQLAVLYPQGYVRAEYAQVSATAVVFDSSAQTDLNYRLQIQLRSGARPVLEIAYENEVRAEQAKKQLDQLLTH